MAIASTARRSGAATRAGPTAFSFARAIDRCLEVTWLTAIVLVPLIVLPEERFFSITSMPKTVALRLLASVVIALMCLRGGHWLLLTSDLRGHGLPARIRRSFGRDDGRLGWSALAVLVVTAASAVFSISPAASLWGKDPSGQGDSLYMTAAYVTMFGAVAWGARTRPQIHRLWVAISLTGLLAALIGVAQSFGISPLGISGTNWVRVTGPSGNPIFYGSLLVVTAPMGAALLLNELKEPRIQQRWLLVTASLGTAVYVLALLSTVSKGPWLAAGVAGIVFAALSAVIVGRRQAMHFCLAAGAGIALATVVFFLPTAQGSDLSSQADGFSDQPSAGQATQPGSASEIVGARAGATGDSVRERFRKWSTSVGLALDRPAVPGSRGTPALLTHLFGYGPDSFRYVYPLRADEAQLAWRSSAAHNDLVNRFVEQGWMGIAAWGALWLAAAAVSVRLMRGARRTPPFIAALGLAILAAMVGRFVEQLSGIPQAGDTLIFWALLGLLIAASRHATSEEHGASATRESIKHEAHWGRVNPLVAFPLTVLGLIAVGTLYIGWERNVDYWRADSAAAIVARGYAAGPAEALRPAEMATRLAPDVPEYLHYLSAVRQDLARLSADPISSLNQLALAYEAESQALARYPYDREMYFRTAYMTWELAKAGVPGMAEETLHLYERLSALSPNDPVVNERLEALRAQVSG